jgi:signal transduction histidine kinase
MERQRLQYERELEQEKEKTRKEYLAMMVHELRSPLNAVVGYANVLKLKLKGAITDSQLSLFDKIIEGGNQLAEQISTTLESSKIEAAKMSAEVSAFNAVPLIRNVCSELDSTAVEKRLELILNVSDEKVLVMADAQHFRQIAINLISNAVKYTARGKITVTLSSVEDPEMGQCVSLAVKDTGCGIPDSQKDSIFKLYQRQEGHVDSDIEGDGYGLAIVGEMVELNHGKILLTTRVGIGSTFTVLFPA